MPLPGWFRSDEFLKAYDLSRFSSIDFEIDYQPTSVLVQGAYLEAREKRVLFARRFSETQDEGLVVLHEAFIMADDLQYQGIAREMLSNSIAFYQAMGIRYVLIPNCIDAGRKVWPKFGFVPDPTFRDEYITHVCALAAEAGEMLMESDCPVGIAFHEFETLRFHSLAAVALNTIARKVSLRLDLHDADVVKLLKKKKIL